jgi:hypothetical protein
MAIAKAGAIDLERREPTRPRPEGEVCSRRHREMRYTSSPGAHLAPVSSN